MMVKSPCSHDAECIKNSYAGVTRYCRQYPITPSDKNV